jgi:tetratricopeptide (TPR) repeat protein
LKSCNSCGVKLLGSEKLFVEDSNNGITESDNNAGKPQNIKKAKKAVEAKGKQISNTQLFYLLFGLLLLGFVVLYSSGVMDSNTSPAAGMVENQKGSSANLANINEINALEQSVKNNPGNLDNLLSLAHLLNDSGFYQKAIERYQQYLKSKPNEADVIVDMGVCYFQLGKHQDALANFKKGIEINPKHQIAHLNMGVVYGFGLKDIKEAVKWWKKTVEFDPNSDIGKKAQEFLNQNK